MTLSSPIRLSTQRGAMAISIPMVPYASNKGCGEKKTYTSLTSPISSYISFLWPGLSLWQIPPGLLTLLLSSPTYHPLPLPKARLVIVADPVRSHFGSRQCPGSYIRSPGNGVEHIPLSYLSSERNQLQVVG